MATFEDNNIIISVNGIPADEYFSDSASNADDKAEISAFSDEALEGENQRGNVDERESSRDENESDNESDKEASETSGKNTPETGAYLVCKGAICKCAVGAAPARLKITSHSKYYVNDASGGDKLVATVKDVNFEEPAFGTCAANNNKKCAPVVTAWELLAGDEHPEAGGNKILTTNGKLTCNTGGLIEVIAHGQVQSVSSIDTEDYSAGIVPAVNCLAPENEIIEGTDKEKAASVITIVCNGQEAKSKSDIIIRKNREVIFEAKPQNVSALKVYDPGLISWSICSRNENEKIPNLKSTNSVTFGNYGETFQITFKKPGYYFIEGYGRKIEQYQYNEKNSAGCVFLIEVIDKNKLKNIKITGENTEFFNEGNVYTVSCGTSAAVEIETLLPLEEAEKTLLNTVAVNKADGSITGIFPQMSQFRFPVISETLHELTISFGEEKKRILIGGISDRVMSISPAISLLRPYQLQIFEAKLKHGNKGNADKIEWYVNGLLENERGARFSLCERPGKVTLEAFIRPAWNLLGKGNLAAKIEFTVKKCGIVDLKPVGNYPPNNIPVYIGNGAVLKAFTDFADYSVEKDGPIQWKIMIVATGKSIHPQHNAHIDTTDGDRGVHEIKTNEATIQFNAKREIVLNPFCPGTYTVSATLNDTVKTVVVVVQKAVIKRWCFTDGDDNLRRFVGWKQDFYIALQVQGWEGREVKINLFLDLKTEKKDEKRHLLLDIEELKSTQKLDAEGKLPPLCIKKDSGLWTMLTQYTYKNSDKNANLYFTVTDTPAICENQKERIYTSAHRKKHIFPDDSKGEIGRYIEVPDKYRISGFFADADNEKLKRIIKYGEPAKAFVFVMPGKSNPDAAENTGYFFSLIENRLKKDVVIIDKEKLPEPDAEGVMKIDIDTINKDIKPEDHMPLGYLPPKSRVFYFQIDSQKQGKKKPENPYIYPENYNTAIWNKEKGNDSHIDLNVKNAAYFLQLKIAKETTFNSSLQNTCSTVIGEELCKKKEEGICVCREYGLIWGKRINCEERKKVIQVCTNIWGESQAKEKANMLMAVMHLETNGTFSPSKENGKGYVGLIQFSQKTAESLGTTYNALKNMSFIQQMNYVEKYLKQNKDKMNTLTDFYLQVLNPNAVGQGNNPNYIVFDESISAPDGDGSKTSKEQRQKNIQREPWVTKYGYASNPSFMKEKGEYSKRKKWVYTRQCYEERWGYHNGKTYIWEIEQELKLQHYDKGIAEKFDGRCVNNPEEWDMGDRAPWMKIAIEEGKKYKNCTRDDEPLKSQIPIYHKAGGVKYSHKIAWCASFASWCLLETGIVNKPQSASSQFFANSSDYKKIDGNKPVYGALIVLKNYKQSNGKACGHGHVSFLLGKTKSGLLIGLGGNQGRRIKLTYYKTSGTCISFQCTDKCGRVDQKYYNLYLPKDYEIKESDYLNEKDIYDMETNSDLDKLNKKILDAITKTEKNEPNN